MGAEEQGPAEGAGETASLEALLADYQAVRERMRDETFSVLAEERFALTEAVVVRLLQYLIDLKRE